MGAALTVLSQNQSTDQPQAVTGAQRWLGGELPNGRRLALGFLSINLSQKADGQGTSCPGDRTSVTLDVTGFHAGWGSASWSLFY